MWMDKTHFKHAQFELLIKHPNVSAMYAVGTLIERSQLEGHWHRGSSILSDGTKGDYPDIRIPNQPLRKSSNQNLVRVEGVSKVG